MASLREEFESLKIRIGKGGANDRLTLIDHTTNQSSSGTATEIFAIMKHRLEKDEGDHMVHIVDHKAERKRKATNPSKSTKVMLNCRTPDQWREFQMAKERYFEIAVDPHIAIDCMIRQLNAIPAHEIAAWVKQGFDHRTGPPKAEIPSVGLPDFLMD